MKNLFVAGVWLLALLTELLAPAHAADLSGSLPTKAPPPAARAAYDWTGYYVGGYLGYASGSSNWSSSPGPGSGLGGTLDLYNSYNAFKGTGSYFLGLEAGYDRMLASRWVIGWQADVSFPSFSPSTVGGTATFGSPATGLGTYADQAEFFGTLRGRVGYSPNFSNGHWLFYATGGFAWSFDQFTRTQLAGVPAGGTATPGTVERLFIVPRVGGVAGTGVEVALTQSWMARLEYLFTDYDSRGVTFPLAGQHFNSDFVTQTVRVGFDYKLGTDGISPDAFTKAPDALELDRFALHGQMNFVEQYVAPFRAPYHGMNSLDSNQGREAWGTMFFAGVKLWDGAEFWVNPEIDQGFGPSDSVGVAGYPGGAAYKVGSTPPYARIQRSFLRQTIDLGGDTQKIEGDQNQFAGSNTTNRLVFTVGKYAPTDMFDQNRYATNPHKDFMNWGLINTGTFDYAGDAWGYTYGAAAEWYQGDWTVRGGLFDLPVVPNSTDLDASFGQFQWIGEIERRWELWSHPGKIAVTGFLSRARLGTFQDAVALAQALGVGADTTPVRQFRSRGGISMNAEQEITSDLGVFMRAGVANGDVEPDVYTDIDRTVAAGFQLKGTQWGRPDDTFGLAGIVNGISAAHQAYLNAGGIGIEVGDGLLPHPGLEQIIETYYAFPIYSWQATLDYQFVANPSYNRDRGPVSLVAFRLYTQF
jgi:high affinity Mn2+ porin